MRFLSIFIALLVLTCCTAGDKRPDPDRHRDTVEQVQGTATESSSSREQTDSLKLRSSQSHHTFQSFSGRVVNEGGRPANQDPSSSKSFRIVGQGVLDRDHESSRSEKWTSTELQFETFDLEPSLSDSMSIIPQKPNVPAVNIRTGTYEALPICGQTFWDVEQLPLPRAAYAQVEPSKERPFAFFVVQPEITFFKHTRDTGTFADFVSDEDFNPETIQFAIDVDGDDVADLIRTEYCCDDVSKPRNTSEGHCQRCSSTYHRDDNGSWGITYHSSPC